MRIIVSETKLTSLSARNCVTLQQVLTLKFAFRPEKLPSLSRNGALAGLELRFALQIIYAMQAYFMGSSVKLLV